VKEMVLVVGGGTMGRGIAGVCALAGHPTSVFEADTAARRSTREGIEASWRRAVERGRLAAGDAAAASERLRIPERLEEADSPEIVLEAVPESLDLKRRVFADLDRAFPGAELLGSNTSSLSITEIGEATGRPERVVGVHFFNPVPVMRLVEVVCGRLTSEAALRKATLFARSLGKQPIRVADVPGFATSRLGVALGLEAMRMVEEGVASVADIDLAMELGYGHPMGPLKTTDLVGLDIRLAIAERLSSGIDAKRFEAPGILRRLVAEGRLGKKTGRGFYVWEGDRPVESEGER